MSTAFLLQTYPLNPLFWSRARYKYLQCYEIYPHNGRFGFKRLWKGKHLNTKPLSKESLYTLKAMCDVCNNKINRVDVWWERRRRRHGIGVVSSRNRGWYGIFTIGVRQASCSVAGAAFSNFDKSIVRPHLRDLVAAAAASLTPKCYQQEDIVYVYKLQKRWNWWINSIPKIFWWI